jgi:aryl-alcohol dehydrogenase-like predicted oxidoreductase
MERHNTGDTCLHGAGLRRDPHHPHAVGRFTHDWHETSAGSDANEFGKSLYAKIAEADRKVVERSAEIANGRGVPRAEVALAWLLHKSLITAPIARASKSQPLEAAMASLPLKFSPEEIAELEESYVPHVVARLV